MGSVKISLIGAASASFGVYTLYDVASSKDLHGSTVSLVDIDAKRLKVMHRVAEEFSKDFDAGLKIERHTDAKEGLEGSDFVIISVEKERMKRWWLDYRIPLKYGLKQARGECGGPGGLAHTLRQVPIIIDICRDIEDACPDAFVMNYSNPESRLTHAMHRYTKLEAIGLCHGIYGRMNFMSMMLGKEVEAWAAGINHFTWILDLLYKDTGKDAYPDFMKMLQTAVELQVKPEVLEKLLESQARAVVREPLSRELCLTFGCYPSPGDGHAAEFLSFGMDMMEDYEKSDQWLKDYENRCSGIVQTVEKIASGAIEAKTYKPPEFRGKAVEIIKAMATNKKYFEYAVNVANNGLIANLPTGVTVEVPATVDSSGVHPAHIGHLPDGTDSLLYPQTIISKLNVEAAYEGSYEKALRALLIDPVVNIKIDAVRKLLDELLEVHAPLLPQFETKR